MKKLSPLLLVSVILFGVGCEPADPSDVELAQMTPEQTRLAIDQFMQEHPQEQATPEKKEEMTQDMRDMIQAGKVERVATLETRTHDTKGEARIVEKEDKRYLALSEDFEVDAGPYLVVLLSTHPDSRDSKEVHAGEVVELGKLMKTNGGQLYEIPKGTNLSQFRTVVIYCKPFKVVFGAGRFQ